MYVIYKSFYRCAKRNAEVSLTGSNGPHVQRKKCNICSGYCHFLGRCFEDDRYCQEAWSKWGVNFSERETTF